MSMRYEAWLFSVSTCNVLPDRPTSRTRTFLGMNNQCNIDICFNMHKIQTSEAKRQVLFQVFYDAFSNHKLDTIWSIRTNRKMQFECFLFASYNFLFADGIACRVRSFSRNSSNATIIQSINLIAWFHFIIIPHDPTYIWVNHSGGLAGRPV